MCLVVSRFVVCKKTPVNVVKQNQTHFRLYSRVNLRVHVTLISPRKRNIKKRSAGLSTMAFTAVWNYCAPLSVITLLSLVGTARCQAVQAENVTVLEGGTAEISCRLQKYDGSIVVIQNPRRQTLFFNGTRALKDDRFQMVLFTPRLVRITLTNVSVSDEGGYFCQLYTDDTHHQVATLSVSVPPDTPTVEVKQEAVEGGEVELTCLSPRSKPPATLRWIRDRREIPGVVSQQENGKTVSVSSTIRLPVERRDNGAAVSCEASHPALGGQKRVRHYRLDVHFAPTVRIIPPPGILREGDSLSLTCSITGNPLPRDVQWTRINDTLPERAEISGPTFQVSRLSQSHNGTYLCQAQNNYGRAADHYTLLVYDPGAVIETHSAVPYAVIGGILALLVFTVICVLIVTIWCSVRQKGSYLTHEASGLDEHGEVQEAFLNGNDASQGKKEYLL
ncbi:cell adhesion molecule 4-like isoform X1 [Salvelinus fontinalis]|uniref:cell adhesion molecule 4-like isoform X1 n=1 Tax=Salvelinus fontinalis TaxID=8038 RepID=UPI00248524A7|nr:cell adhesion molecule 4-like isoform X1 [Salvelinus fontinalis]